MSVNPMKEDATLLYVVEYKNWYSGEATSKFDGNSYTIRSANFWQSQFEVFRNDLFIGKFSFNWKGEIIITYTNTNGIENEMLFQYKGIWKFRFILSDRSGNELLAMVSSWSNLKYHYDVSVGDGLFQGNETKELLMICGYSANLYMTTMMAVMNSESLVSLSYLAKTSFARTDPAAGSYHFSNIRLNLFLSIFTKLSLDPSHNGHV